MCNKCYKMWEIYAQTKLEMLKQGIKSYKTLCITCPKCKEIIFIVEEL